jgi:hypothetical protein
MFNPKLWFVSRIEDFKAWRRGEVRIAPDGVRGRVFQSRGKVNVEMLVTRADGTVEKRIVPGKLSFFKH